MVLFIIAILFLILAFVCHARFSKRLLWISAAVVIAAASAFFWTDPFLAAAGCQTDPIEGVLCPEPTLLTQIAIAHSAIAVFALAAGVFAAPAITLVALWFETRYRRRARNG